MPLHQPNSFEWMGARTDRHRGLTAEAVYQDIRVEDITKDIFGEDPQVAPLKVYEREMLNMVGSKLGEDFCDGGIRTNRRNVTRS